MYWNPESVFDDEVDVDEQREFYMKWHELKKRKEQEKGGSEDEDRV